MRTPHPGDVVRIRDQRWRVLRCTRHDTSATLYVEGTGREQAPRRATFVLPFEHYESLPEIDTPRRVPLREWRRVARVVLGSATPSPLALRSAATANFSLLPFQLAPAVALLRGLATRVLLADAVGLGKTVQAGLVIAETLARAPAARVLVVTPASLRAQWIDELRHRFGLEMVQHDATAIATAMSALPAGANPWGCSPLVIASIDYIKRPDVIRAMEPLVWDMVVFDEAHGLCGRSDRNMAAAALARRARLVILATATPHTGDDEAFERLCGIGELPGEPPLLIFRRDRNALGVPMRRTSRALRIHLSEPERAMHRLLEDYGRAAERDAGGAPGGRLAIEILRRRSWSSAASLAISARRRIQLLSDTVAVDTGQLSLFACDAGDAEPFSELSVPAIRDRAAEIRWLTALATSADRAALVESKFRFVQRLLRRVAQPAIVFTQYRDTVAGLAAYLGDEAIVLHGGMTSRERRRVIDEFVRGNARVLLATDAASEGLNLHHRCRLVVNLEVPWTPLRLEQRIGRVDRIGQSRRVHALHLIGAGTSEHRAHTVIGRREAHAESALTGTVLPAVEEGVAQERAWLERARQLTAALRVHLPSRPVVTTSRRTPGEVRAYTVPFADACGLLTWELVVGIASGPKGDARPDAALDRFLAETLTSIRRECETATSLRILRERNLITALRQENARLAARLLQPGLFDRRAERTASAQSAVLANALASCEEHLQRLDQWDTLTPLPARMVFGLLPR